MTADDSDSDATTAPQVAGLKEDDARAPTPDRSASDDEQNLPLDVVFDILKNGRRRLVLRHLVDVSQTTTLGDLSEYVAAVENGKSRRRLTSAETKRVYVALYQSHLPRMADAGIIDFESDRGTVRLADHDRQLTRYIDVGDDDPVRDWTKYYAVLAAVGGVLLVTQQWFVSEDVLSAFIVGAVGVLFAGLVLAHGYERGVPFSRWFRHGRRPTRKRS